MTSGFLNKTNNSESHKVITLENITFVVKVFNRKKQEDIEITTRDLEIWGYFDPGRYNKKELQELIKSFLQKMDFKTFYN